MFRVLEIYSFAVQSSGAVYTVSARDQNFFFKPATRTRGTAKIFTKGMKMIDGQD